MSIFYWLAGGVWSSITQTPPAAGPAMAAARSRYWCFTEHAYPQALAPTLELEGLPLGITYLCGQLERGEQHDKTHFQGYLELEAHQRVGWLKKNLSPTAHFEIRRGTQEEAIGYTQKADTSVKNTWIELGVPTKDRPGKRNDLLEVKALLDEGAPEEEIADSHFGAWVRYNRSFALYRQLKSRNAVRGPVTTTLWLGPPGAGKTTMARLAAGVPDSGGPALYEKPPGHKWFDDYNGQDMILLDEHNSKWMEWDFLMALMNPVGGPLLVEPKGKPLTPCLATRIFITCNKAPEYWYNSDKNVTLELLPALYRRLSTGGWYSCNVTHNAVFSASYP